MMIANNMQLFKANQFLIAGCIITLFFVLSNQIISSNVFLTETNTQNQAALNNLFKEPNKPLELYPEIGPKKVNTILFNPAINKTTKPALIIPAPNLNDYTLNIFCTETTKTYVKAVSGSGVFLTDPRDTQGVILTNAHVARHLLDQSKQCVGRTGSPAVTTHRLKLRYVPSFWLNNHNQYIIGDPDQSSTGEYDFAIIETEIIKPKKTTNSVYDVLKQNLSLRFDNYARTPLIGNTYIYSYPAQQTLSKNIYNPLFQKKDTVTIGEVYASPAYGEPNSLLDVIGSSQIDHGSSGGMVVSVDTQNSLVGISSILIKSNQPQIVRVVTLRHVFSVMEKDLSRINNAQTDSFLQIIQNSLKKQDNDLNISAILKNPKLTSVLELNTRTTLINLHIISK